MGEKVTVVVRTSVEVVVCAVPNPQVVTNREPRAGKATPEGVAGGGGGKA